MLPDEIDLPRNIDFCRGAFHKGEQCCFLGWRNTLLYGMDGEENIKFRKAAVEIAEKMGRHSGPNDIDKITAFNDDKRNPPRKLAEWFARTVERMGYDIEE